MAGDKVQLACERRRAEMELAAGETDRKADRYGFIGLMIAERMQACGNPVEASCCDRSEEHTSELQSLMRISYAVFCLKKKNTIMKSKKKTHKHLHKPQQV